MCINRAARFETVLPQQVLHHSIILVRIRAEIRHPFQAPGDARVADSPYRSVGCQSVNGSVRLLVQPMPVFDQGVGGIVAHDEAKGPDDSSSPVKANETMPRRDFLLHQRPLRIAVDPLMRVSRQFHESSGVFEKLHEGEEILRLRFPYADRRFHPYAFLASSI